MNKRKTVWSSKYCEDQNTKQIVSDIAKSNGISEICASLLYNRAR